MSSPSDKMDLEAVFEASESIEALMESNPKLYEELKAHFSATPAPPESGVVDRRSSKISTFFRGQSRRFSLDALPPTVAEIMALFDFDGNGKVTLDEVRQGAQELKASRKKNKIAVWAMIIQFLVYTALTAGSCGVLYHFLYLMKDTTVDAETGALMVKDGDENNVEVSVKSHGKSFSYDGVAVDAITGEEKGCVSASQAVEMFEQVIEGTSLKFVEEDAATGAVSVVSVGTNSSVWTDSIMDLGGLVLVPDADCVQAHGKEEGNGGNRFLSSEDVLDANIALRAKFMEERFGSTGTMSRRLEDLAFLKQQVKSMEEEIGALQFKVDKGGIALSDAKDKCDKALEDLAEQKEQEKDDALLRQSDGFVREKNDAVKEAEDAKDIEKQSALNDLRVKLTDEKDKAVDRAVTNANLLKDGERQRMEQVKEQEKLVAVAQAQLQRRDDRAVCMSAMNTISATVDLLAVRLDLLCDDFDNSRLTELQPLISRTKTAMNWFDIPNLP